jgi:acetyl-CoA acyltransferase 2
MSMSPYTLHGIRFGNTRYGVDQKLVDSLAAALVDQAPGGHPGAAPTPMGGVFDIRQVYIFKRC